MPSMKLTQGIALLAALLPAAKAQTEGGVFIVTCGPLTVQRGDPIVFPGTISPHVHAVVGGTAFQQTQSNEDAVGAVATTCNKILDNSNYWQPQLYHEDKEGKFEMVEMTGIAAYYLDRACDYKEGTDNCDGTPAAIAPPAGLRMVVGDPSRRTYDETNNEHIAISHVCLEPADDTHDIKQEPCREMRLQTYFPSCWNGVDVDSDNHKSHMSFPAGNSYDSGMCPESHPVAILSVFYEFFYDTAAITDFNRWVYAQGDTTGYGLHGDYLQGWSDQVALENAMGTCTGPNGPEDANCSLNVGPNGTPGEVTEQPLEQPAPGEEVGHNGKLDKLPGNNPVSKRSARMRN